MWLNHDRPIGMQVCQIHKYYHPHVGGIEGHVQRLAEGLAARGGSVRVLTSTPRGVGGSERINGVAVRRTGSLGEALSVPLAPTFPLWTRSDASGVDVAHVHLPDPLAVVSYLLADPDTDHLVATYHSDIVRQTTALRFYGPVLERFLNRTDRIITTSPRLRDNSAFLADHREKCTVVPLGIDADKFGSHDGPHLDVPGDDEEPVVLFVGRLIYYKGVEYLVEAIGDVDARLVVVGDGELRPALERQAEDLDVADRVFFLGGVGSDELHSLYEQADVFALPSCAPSEAFGIVQLEAMAYETPVVNTDLPTGVPWVSQDGETGLTVDPEAPGQLADAIATLVDDAKKRHEFGRNGRARVEAEFTTEKAVSRVRAVYDELGAGGRRRAGDSSSQCRGESGPETEK